MPHGPLQGPTGGVATQGPPAAAQARGGLWGGVVARSDVARASLGKWITETWFVSGDERSWTASI